MPELLDIAGAAHLELAGNVPHLHPQEAVFAAMVEGWERQQSSRGLSVVTMTERAGVVRRFAGVHRDMAVGVAPWGSRGLDFDVALGIRPTVALDIALLPEQPGVVLQRRPGLPQHPATVMRRLAALEIPLRMTRNSALLHLARELPPVVIADLLGIRIPRPPAGPTPPQAAGPATPPTAPTTRGGIRVPQTSVDHQRTG